MSNEKIEIIIPGYQGPFYGETLERIHAILYDSSKDAYAGNDLLKLFKQAFGEDLVGQGPNGALDAISWFYTFSITRGEYEFVLAIPWRTDWDLRDGTRSDCLSAVYVSNGAPLSAAEELLGEVLELLTEHEKERKDAPPAKRY